MLRFVYLHCNCTLIAFCDEMIGPVKNRRAEDLINEPSVSQGTLVYLR